MSMYKYILLLFLFLSFSKGYAQFNTLRPAERISFRIVTHSPAESTAESEYTEQQGKEESPWLLPSFSSPIDTLFITSKYGYRIDPFTKKRKFHAGIDLYANESAVMSMLQGEVLKVGYEKRGLGKYIVLQHGDFEVTYGHLSSILVRKKEHVAAGKPVGISGNTGRSTGEHLHLGLKYKGKRVDPLPFLLFIQKRASSNKNILALNNANMK